MVALSVPSDLMLVFVVDSETLAADDEVVVVVLLLELPDVKAPLPPHPAIVTVIRKTAILLSKLFIFCNASAKQQGWIYENIHDLSMVRTHYALKSRLQFALLVRPKALLYNLRCNKH